MTQEDESLTYNDLKNYYVNDGPKAICRRNRKRRRKKKKKKWFSLLQCLITLTQGSLFSF
jgi:hypothetical protein